MILRETTIEPLDGRSKGVQSTAPTILIYNTYMVQLKSLLIFKG
jgi:hypothetical protein